MAQKKGMTAWLITWETTGSHVRHQKRGAKKYAVILNPHWSADLVCCIMELLLRYEDQVDLQIRLRMCLELVTSPGDTYYLLFA
jgi:hypothetical protein